MIDFATNYRQGKVWLFSLTAGTGPCFGMWKTKEETEKTALRVCSAHQIPYAWITRIFKLGVDDFNPESLLDIFLKEIQSRAQEFGTTAGGWPLLDAHVIRSDLEPEFARLVSKVLGLTGGLYQFGDYEVLDVGGALDMDSKFSTI